MNAPPYLRLVHSRAEPNGKKSVARSAPPRGEIILYFGPPRDSLAKTKAPKVRCPRKSKNHPPGWPGRYKFGSGLSLDHVRRQATLVRVEGAVALYRFERDDLVYRVPRTHLKVIDKDTITVTREWLTRASPSGWR